MAIEEEIGMLDHLTGGRLKSGQRPGIPDEMAKIGLGYDEARARNDDALNILDAALKSRSVRTMASCASSTTFA